MIINYNVSSMIANNALARNDSALSKSLERLSSGYKINHAKDNAAGLAMSRRMNAQLKGLSVAGDNANDGISIVEIADGAMSEVHDILQRMNELAVKSSNGTLTDEDRGMIDAVKNESLTIEKLEAMTAVCSVGLDMIVVSGDTSSEVISALIADEAAIGMINCKTTAVRVIPAIGKKDDEMLEFGGLLGYGPIMKISKLKPNVFINRGGQIPAPLNSLKN